MSKKTKDEPEEEPIIEKRVYDPSRKRVITIRGNSKVGFVHICGIPGLAEFAKELMMLEENPYLDAT